MIQHELGRHGIILCMKFNAIERIECACIPLTNTHTQARTQHTRKQSSNIFYTFIMKLRANPVIKFKANRIIAAPNKFASIILHFSLTLVRLQFNPHVKSIFVVVADAKRRRRCRRRHHRRCSNHFLCTSFLCLPACLPMCGRLLFQRNVFALFIDGCTQFKWQCKFFLLIHFFDTETNGTECFFFTHKKTRIWIMVRGCRRSRLLHVRNWLIKLSIDVAVIRMEPRCYMSALCTQIYCVYVKIDNHSDRLARSDWKWWGKAKSKKYLIKWKWQIIDYKFGCSSVGIRLSTCYFKSVPSDVLIL